MLGGASGEYCEFGVAVSGEIVAWLMAAGAATLERVPLYGMLVRASAGASSFRRRKTLVKRLEEAPAQVARLAKERKHSDPGVSQRPTGR